MPSQLLFYLLLPKPNYCILEFKFITAPAQPSSGQDQSSYISAFLVAYVNQNGGEDFGLVLYKTTYSW